ncbi:cation diffusion facilitator family transporter [Actibacterium sp. MT2.3-13A]|uniref:cation diffusion facilitator family transporter n=1 Tax=Actibacterium sp. MT2.3-13A TaxID=2828332 RepID=UPI001BA4C4B2|nr:cation diffusion facilitator family transporter [Actibacterium sp. MT2.3-13A]
MPHDHHRHHIDPAAGDRQVALAVAVNMLLTLVQIVGGLLSGSVALIADAVHNFSDAVSLIIAYGARRIARRPHDANMTFGYGRAEAVAALVNYTTLIVIGAYLVYEAVLRLIDPPGVQGWIVVVVAGVALVVDLVTAALTFRLSKHSMNIRAAFLHNLADAASSVAVIVAGSLILLYDWRLVDPLATLGIAGFILWSALSEIRPVIRLLMLGAPPALDLDVIRDRVLTVEGVESLHHLHLWQIDEHKTSLEAHLVIGDGAVADFAAVNARVKELLAREFGIRHATLELETNASGCADQA